MGEPDKSMGGKVCLITGATSGIGRVSASALAGMGATVIVHGRNREKCANTVEEIKKKSENTNVEYILADLSALDDVRRLAEEFADKYSRLHVLLNNAGGIFYNCESTKEGVEMTFTVNYLSHFLLTNLLLDTLKASSPARIINVSSKAHWGANFDFEHLACSKGYFGWDAYGRSKLANILFTYELARRLDGTGVTANALHPGFVATNFGKNNRLMNALMSVAHLGALSPEEGAKTSIYLATSPEVEGVSGKYFEREKARPSSKKTYDMELAKRLWDISSGLVKT